MEKKILKESFISNFIGGFLKDVHSGQVNVAVAKAKKRNLPNKAVKQMEKIRQDVVDLERYLNEIP